MKRIFRYIDENLVTNTQAMIRLNKREEEVMNILWQLKRAFPKEVIDKITPPAPPYNTVLSMIRKLENDGFIRHEKVGKSHQYFPKVSKKAYQKSIFSHLLSDYFGGSPKKLVSFFLKEENLSNEEIEEILSKYSKDK